MFIHEQFQAIRAVLHPSFLFHYGFQVSAFEFVDVPPESGNGLGYDFVVDAVRRKIRRPLLKFCGLFLQLPYLVGRSCQGLLQILDGMFQEVRFTRDMVFFSSCSFCWS